MADRIWGAQFELQRENGTKINLVKVSDGVFRPAKGTETVADDKTVVTDNNGKLQFTGLKEGTYKVKEIKAPTGYNLLKDPITVTIASPITIPGILARSEERRVGKEC